MSFLCLASLVGLAPVQWYSRSITVSSLLVWLLVCNLIQGVNSVVWAGNEVIRSPVWCDIGKGDYCPHAHLADIRSYDAATKVLLGALVALPATCLCLCRRLWRCSSGMEDAGRLHLSSFDFILCIILPIVYMGLRESPPCHWVPYGS